MEMHTGFSISMDCTDVRLRVFEVEVEVVFAHMHTTPQATLLLPGELISILQELPIVSLQPTSPVVFPGN